MTNSFIINFEKKVRALENEARQFKLACQADATREGNSRQYPENRALLADVRFGILCLQGELQEIFDETKK